MRLGGRALRVGERAADVTERGEALLQVKRNRVVDLRADPGLRQVRPQRIAPGDPDDVLVEDVVPVRRLGREADAAGRRPVEQSPGSGPRSAGAPRSTRQGGAP